MAENQACVLANTGARPHFFLPHGKLAFGSLTVLKCVQDELKNENYFFVHVFKSSTPKNKKTKS